MKRLACLFVLAACHHADPPPPVDNGSGSGLPVTTCGADGAAIFTETRHDLHANPPPNQPPSYTLVIRDSGSWSATGEHAGSGCLGADALAAVRQRLDAASFTTVHPDIHCMTMPIVHTDYEVPNKPALALETPCGVTTTDAPTLAAIACAEASINGQACE
jgi:hypothetical protein